LLLKKYSNRSSLSIIADFFPDYNIIFKQKFLNWEKPRSREPPEKLRRPRGGGASEVLRVYLKTGDVTGSEEFSR